MFDYDNICSQIICNCSNKDVGEDIYGSKVIMFRIPSKSMIHKPARVQ